MNSDTGKIFIAIGFSIILIGVGIYFFHNKLDWIGNLPGDIKIERKNFRLYVPFTTMILFSIIVTLILRIWRWFR